MTASRRLPVLLLALLASLFITDIASAMYAPGSGRFMQRDPLGHPDGMNSYAAYHVLHGGVDPLGLRLVVTHDGTRDGERIANRVERIIEHDSGLDAHQLLFDSTIENLSQTLEPTQIGATRASSLRAQGLAAHLVRFFADSECVEITIHIQSEGGYDRPDFVDAFGDFGAKDDRGTVSGPTGLARSGEGLVNLYLDALLNEGVDDSQVHKTLLHELLHAYFALRVAQKINADACDVSNEAEGVMDDFEALNRIYNMLLAEYQYPAKDNGRPPSGLVPRSVRGADDLEQDYINRENAGTIPVEGDRYGISLLDWSLTDGYHDFPWFNSDLRGFRDNWVTSP